MLSTAKGDVSISRSDGRLATLSSPGQPDRPVALKRRELDELLNEELRRLDPDDVYAATVRRMVEAGGPTAVSSSTTRKRAARGKATASKPRTAASKDQG